MSIAPGSRIGSYEISAAIGAGGMGEVYRAKDSKLKRDVAIKVLPADVAGDRERLARFQREAEVLATLNHAHIAQIYGIEESNGTTALVMELVEGDDLAQRLQLGPIPLEEALPVARQIADALEAAHDAGIVHRDLKPANIKVRPDGAVKVLDFGLAKPGASAASVGDNSPTITSPAVTQRGVIMGTAAYMSPEQAKGKAVDKRTDIWAFGCVLYEMLTRKKVFEGDDVTDTVTSIMRDTPDWALLPANTPPTIRILLRRCLEKDPRKRVPHIAVARIEIDDAMSSTGELVGGRAPEPPSRARLITWAATTVLVALAAVAGFVWARRSGADATPLTYRSTVLLSENVQSRSPSQRMALSPDGRTLAYVGTPAGQSDPRLYVRSLDSWSGRQIDGTERAYAPFWSPDGRYIAFIVEGALKKVAVTGGAPIQIATGLAPYPGSWNKDNVILATGARSLVTVPADGGTPSPIAAIAADKETLPSYPSFLPDGRHFLYTAYRDVALGSLYIGSLDGAAPVKLVDGAFNGQFASDRLVFVRNGTLFAQPFNPATLALSGEAIAIVDPVLVTMTNFRAGGFSVSQKGVLVYQSAAAIGAARLAWATRGGALTPIIDEPALYRDMVLSPDGSTAALSRIDPRGASDIWLLNTHRGVLSRLTFDGGAVQSAWMPDSRSLIYRSGVVGTGVIHRKQIDSSGAEETLTDEAISYNSVPAAVSPDGRTLLIEKVLGVAESNVLALPIDPRGKPEPILAGKGAQRWSQYSPNGKWIAYVSDESGRPEVYVTTATGRGRWQITGDGGTMPRWSHDNREIYFIAAGKMKLMAAAVQPQGDGLEVTSITPLFDLRVPEGFARRFYDVAPDGRFLVSVTDSGSPLSQQLMLVVNWAAPLEGRK